MRILFLILCSISLTFGQGNPIEVSYNSDLKDYEFLKGKLDNYKIFFDGEHHHVSSNETRHFNLFKFLYYNNGVRYFIQEYGFEWGYYVNKYLQTGDFSWIESGISSKESGELYNQLFEFNESLPQDEKILFVSLDAYRFTSTEYYIDKLTINKGEQPENIRKVIDIVKTIKRTHSVGLGTDIRGKDSKHILAKLKTVRKMVSQEQSAFKKYFGEDYIFFHLLVFNYASEKRVDSNLAANFFEFSKIHNDGNYYLFYGDLHCQLKPNWFAGRLNNSSYFKNQVCSFTSQYRDSEFLLFQKKPSGDSWTVEPKKQENFGIINSGPYKKEIIERLVSETTADCTLYPASYIGNGLEKGTTYLYFLKNQKATESYYGKK